MYIRGVLSQEKRSVSQTTNNSPNRIVSVDQFRGYTIAGMALVNFIGGFPSISEFFKHHGDYMTYADTIAPIFLFVAGMGFRLSMLRNTEKEGVPRAMFLGARRYALLTLIGILFYGPLDWTEWWDALVDIGLSGILTLPFILCPATVRIAAAFAYLTVYQVLFTFSGYGTWVMTHSLDGGPLGPLSWVFCMLLGTIAYDIIATRDTRKTITAFLAWGIALCVLGWGFRAEWPGIKPFWCFSQQAMSFPYPVYATGLAFLTYLPFFLLSDVWKMEIPTFTVMGANPFVLYILQGAYTDIHGSIVPQDSETFLVLLTFAGLYLMYYLVARYMYRNRMFVKIG